MVKTNFYYPFNNQFIGANGNFGMMGSGPPSQSIPNQSNENYGMYHPQMNMPEMGSYANSFQNMNDPNAYFHNPYTNIKMEEGFVSGNREDTFSQNAPQKEEVHQKRKYTKENKHDQYNPSKNRP